MNKLYFLPFLLLCSFLSFGQTKGLIYKPAATAAGRAVLDPNQDGYTADSPAGFQNNDHGNGESELKYTPIPILENEPIQDPLRGPGCGFTDMVDSGIGDPVMFYFDGTNFLVRFRLNKSSPNSKGYSVLIDTDQKFGFNGPNADPNAVPGNPGFEQELVLRTNHGIGLYNIDGTTTPSLIAEKDYEAHSQKSIAYTEECGDMDYFYDFYLPWSDFGLPATTKLRMAALTVMNPHPATGNNAKSDVGGVDDTKYGGNYDKLFEDFIQNYNPTSPQDNNIGLLARTLCPAIDASILVTSTSITGSSAEAAGTIITVFKNNVAFGTTAMVTSGGTWSLSVSGLAEGDVITASAKASGKEASETNCTGILVGQVCTRPGMPTLAGSNGNSNKYVTITAAATGFIDLYFGNDLLVAKAPVTAGTTYYFCSVTTGLTTSNTCSGGNNLMGGVYRATLTVNGCSSNSAFLCVNTTNASAIPVINSPITTMTRFITGTAAANSQVILKVNGAEKVRVVVDADMNWSIPASSLGLTDADKVSAYALEAGNCQSPETTPISVTKLLSVAPILTGTYCGATTVVTGTSSEAAGTSINIFVGAAAVATTTTNAAGNWQISGLAISPGSQLTAKATAPGKGESVASAAVTVNGVSSVAGISIIGTTDPVTSEFYIPEDANAISGTGPAGTGLVSLYLDEMFIGSGTLAGEAWTVKKADFPNDFFLFAGAKLTATFTASGGCESAHTTPMVAIRCVPPVDKAITPTSLTLCTGATPEVTVQASQAYLIYQLYNGTTPIGASRLGTGGDILLKTASPLTTTTPNTILNLKVVASKIPYVQGVNCELSLSEQVQVTLNPEIEANTIRLAGAGTEFCGATHIGVLTGTTPTGGNGSFTYQWQISTDNTNWSDITDATDKDYNPGLVLATTYYRRQVYSGACANLDASASIEVIIHDAVVNTITYSGQTAFCVSGNPTEISGNADVAFDRYQWQSSPDGINFGNIAGATAPAYTPAILSQTTTFRRVVNNGTCDSYSAPITISVYPAVANNKLTAPATVILCGAGNVGEIAGETPTGGNNTYAYQWQKSTDNGIIYSDITPAVTTRDYTPGNVASTTFFKRLVTSGPCANAESDVVKITVISSAKTSITTDASILAADGTSSTTVRVQLKDDFGTDITTDACNLNLTTDKGTITNIAYAGNGSYTATLTAGIVAGVASITGTINGTGITDDVAVTLQAAVKLAATSITADPSVLYADGSSTSQATIAFQDYAGDPIAVDAAKVELSIDNATVTAEDKGNGVFTTTVPARSTAAQVVVTAKYDNTKAGGEATVEFVPVPVVAPTLSLTASVVSASPEQVDADGTRTAIAAVQFKGDNGMNMAVDAAKVRMFLDNTGVSFTDRGNGLFTATVPARTTAATVAITASYDGTALSDDASVTFIPVVDLAATVVTASPAQVNADGTSTSTAKVEFKDYEGNAIAVDASKVGIQLDGTAATVSAGTAGVFTAAVPARTTAATVAITASYDGTALSDDASVVFVPAVDLAATVVTASPAQVNADGTSTSTAKVEFKDYEGNAIAVDATKVGIQLDGTAATVSAGTVGVFTAAVPARTAAATVAITANYNGSTVASKAAVAFVPVTNPVLSLQLSTVEANPSIVVADGVSTSLVTVQLKDTDQNSFVTDEPVTITSNLGTVGSITNSGNGSYSATLTSTHTGTATIKAKVGAAELTAKPAVTFVALRPAAASATAAAARPSIPADGVSTSVITVTLFDAQGNRITTGGDNVVLATSSGILGPLTDHNDGTYTVVLTSATTGGTAVVSGTVNGAAIKVTANIVFTAIPLVNRAPLGTNDHFTANNREKLLGNLLLNDSDPDGNQLSLKPALVRQPIYGSLVLLANGNFTYTPDKGYIGEDSFIYEVCDNGSPAMCTQATVTIQVKQAQVFIPAGFSPDGDGENDLFVIYGAEQYQVSLKVFNRWGDIVFESKVYKNDWNGAANHGFVFGDKLPDGTYFYLLDLNNGEKPKTHSLTIKTK